VLLGIWLYFDDLKNRGGILDKVEDSPTDLMTSPVVGRRTETDNDNDFEIKEGADDVPEGVVVTAGNMDVYKENADLRASLRRSLAR